MTTDSFHFLLMISQASVQKAIMRRLRDTSLSPGQPKVLEYLEENDGARPGEIAKACHIEPPSLTSVLSRMEHSGLITRSGPTDDRRSVRIFATDLGKSLTVRISDEFAAIEQEAFRGFSEEERSRFMEYLSRIYGNLSRG